GASSRTAGSGLSARCAAKRSWTCASRPSAKATRPTEMGPPRLALVPGEPAGVGPELCVRLAQRRNPAALVALADPDVMRDAAARLGLPLRLLPPAQAREACPGELALLPVPVAGRARPGHPDPANARSVIDALLQ